MVVALPIITHLTGRSYFEPARPSERTPPGIAEFQHGGEILCLDPVSGHRAITTPCLRQEVHAELMRRRLEWLQHPPTDGTTSPLAPVTVTAAGRCPSRGDEQCFEENGCRDGGLSPEYALKLLRLVGAFYPGRDRLFVFDGRELPDWRAFESLAARCRAEEPAPAGTTHFLALVDPAAVTPAIANRLRELDIIVHARVGALPSARGHATSHAGSQISFERAMRGCERLREAGVRPGVIFTVPDPADLLNVFSCLRDRGFNQMSLRPPRRPAPGATVPDETSALDGEEAFFARYAAGMMDVARAICDYNRAHAGKVIEYGLAVRAARLAGGEWPGMCLGSLCGATSGRALGLDGRGNVFPCGAMFGFPELAAAHISSISTGEDLTHALGSAPVSRCLRTRHVRSIDRCAACPIQRFCGGGCASESYLRYGELNREGAHCALEQELFVELLWQLTKEPEKAELLCPSEHQADLPSVCQWAALA